MELNMNTYRFRWWCQRQWWWWSWYV